MKITRRQLLLAGAAVALCPRVSLAKGVGQDFVLPPLTYAFNALEPSIDAQTMEIHHDKHHAAYVANLNAALKDAPDPWRHAQLEELLGNVERLPESIRTAVRNNGGGHYNHSLFWKIMGPPGGSQPSPELAAALAKNFGSVDQFKSQLIDAGMAQFGSGWAWLTMFGDGGIGIERTPNQDNPMMQGHFPVLGVDVWEHAYYLKYQNLRKDYLTAWWKVVDWGAVSQRYAEGLKRFKVS